MPIGVSGAVALGSAAIGAAGSIIGGSQAASASKAAADAQKQMYAQTRQDLQPYNEAGQFILPQLKGLALSGPYGPGGTNYLQMAQDYLPPQMTQAQLEATPGYQFTMQQGLQQTQNAAAAKGLGVSGAALKGAAGYATGLANSTYKDQFALQQQRFSDVLNLNTTQQANLTNQFSRLSGVATLGANAAAQTGQAGTTAAGNQGNFLQAGGQESGAGIAGVGNAISGGLQNYLALQKYQQQTATPAGGSGGSYNNSDLIPAGGMNTSGNTWYN